MQKRLAINKFEIVRIKNILPWFVFCLIALIMYLTNAFPALYGDEYGTLNESQHLLLNIHAIGYLSLLNVWSRISQADWFLRLLSIIWYGAGLFWLKKWLAAENISEKTKKITFWLMLLNPFLWMYGFQIRFYSMFFATSILFVWRFRLWQKLHSKKNIVLLVASFLLLVASDLFGFLVIATIGFNFLWSKLGKKKWIIVMILFLFIAVLFATPLRSLLVSLVYKVSNSYANVPTQEGARGINIGMLAKIPLTFYFFILGLRVYPLWWWITAPAMLFVGVAFLLGIIHIRCLGDLGSLSVFMIFNVFLMYLVLDPLAPSGLQGANPRYLIYVLPYMVLFIAEGVQAWNPSRFILVAICLFGLFFIARPSWSYDSSDLVNWPGLMKKYIVSPKDTCVVIDGRSADPVMRYSPQNTKIINWKPDDCLGYSRILLVTDDYRLSMVSGFDEISDHLASGYSLTENQTLFPEQITVFDKLASGKDSAVLADRLDLPEEDLQFPISIQSRSWPIPGFIRLDTNTQSKTILNTNATGAETWLLTNYRTTEFVNYGTPVFSITLHLHSGEDKTLLLRAGIETSNWNGNCEKCTSIFSWEKKVSLVGTAYYPGAYQQYNANIWGIPIDVKMNDIDSIKVDYLLADGTGYYYGSYPEN